MQKISCTQPIPDYNALIPEERQLFGKFVHDLRKNYPWMTVEDAQRRAYQLVCAESLKDVV